MGPVVSVAGGRLAGTGRDGVWLFAGIPYARAPIGPLRWRSPQPPEPWAGVRDATAFGPMAPQPRTVPGANLPVAVEAQDEDCLTLNVWSPGLDDRRRPVMVWIHGGGFTSGTGAALLYDGARLASRYDVVTVTLNYRLGVLGFLGHPALVADHRPVEAVGNWGLLDQLAALRWIRDNITAFGGDPTNVTVFGESAGGMSVSALLGAPSARGLFHRAVVQSGPPHTHSAERAASVAESLAAVLGLDAVERRLLETVPAADLVAATQQLEGEMTELGSVPVVTLPVVDGRFLPRPPEVSVALGSAASVPLLIGTNRDELSFFGLGRPDFAEIDEVGLEAWFAAAAPGAPSGVVDGYRRLRAAAGQTTAAYNLWVAVGTDLVFRRPSLHLAAAQRTHQPGTFVYLFTQPTPLFGGALGACHALELPFVFDAVDEPVVRPFVGEGEEVVALTERMGRYWTDFARDGNPGGDQGDEWPTWDPQRRATMVLGPYGEMRGGVVEGPDDEAIELWGPLGSGRRDPWVSL